MLAKRICGAALLLALPQGCGSASPEEQATRLAVTDGSGNQAALSRSASPDIEATSVHSPGLNPQAAAPFGGATSLGALDNGQSAAAKVTLPPGKTMIAQFVPSSAKGDVQMYLCDQGTKKCWFSANPSGHAEYLQARNLNAQEWNGLVAFSCEGGPCAPGTVAVSFGDDKHLERTTIGVNQIAIKNAGTCIGSAGNSISSGYCMCAPSSAASELALVGAIPASTEDIQASAKKFFASWNNSQGGAIKTKVIDGLESFGYKCKLVSSFEGAKECVLGGGVCLIRSKNYISTGHYTTCDGFDEATKKLKVMDPYGDWKSKGNWAQNSSTDPGDTKGRDTWMDWKDLDNGDTQILSCQGDGESACAVRDGNGCASQDPQDPDSDPPASPQPTQPSSSCAHSLCTPGQALSAGCSPCATKVCNLDPFCCQNAWDDLCTKEASSWCGSCAAPTQPSSSTPAQPPPNTPAQPSSQTSCAHPTSKQGSPLAAGCSPCATKVCAQDPYCCAQGWDALCTQEAQSWCKGAP